MLKKNMGQKKSGSTESGKRHGNSGSGYTYTCTYATCACGTQASACSACHGGLKASGVGGQRVY
jgi:hypothetical protein